MNRSIVICLLAAAWSHGAAAETAEEKAEAARRDLVSDSIAEMVYQRDELRKAGYAVFAETAATTWEKRRRMSSRPDAPGRPHDGTDEQKRAWFDKWMAVDPDSISKTPPPPAALWTMAVRRPGHHYCATANPARTRTMPTTDFAGVTYTPLGKLTAWSEYFTDAEKVWKVRHTMERSPTPPWQIKPADEKLRDWQGRQDMTHAYYPFDSLTHANPLRTLISHGNEPLQFRFLNRFELVETSAGLRGQVIARFNWTVKQPALGGLVWVNQYTLTLDPAFGMLPVTIETEAIGRKHNRSYHRTEITWQKRGKLRVPVRIENVRSDYQWQDTETTDRTVLHWTVGENVPTDWYSDDPRAMILAKHGKDYIGPTGGELNIFGSTNPIGLPAWPAK